MFGIGMQELIIVLIVALIFLGPKRLPEIAKALGRGVKEFRKATQEVKESVDLEGELREIEKEVMMEEVETKVSKAKEPIKKKETISHKEDRQDKDKSDIPQEQKKLDKNE
jgi:Tat protein translocase TatB subunit